jgi:predicted outer membrane repeat protein
MLLSPLIFSKELHAQVYVSSFPEIQTLYQAGGQNNVSLSTDIFVGGQNLNSPGVDLDMAVNLDGNVLSFNSGGITLSGSDKELGFTNGKLYFDTGGTAISNSGGSVMRFSHVLADFANFHVNVMAKWWSAISGMAIINRDDSFLSIDDSVLNFYNCSSWNETDEHQLTSVGVINNHLSNLTINNSILNFLSNKDIIAQQDAASAFAVAGVITNFCSTMTITASTMTFSDNITSAWSNWPNNGVNAGSQINNQYSFMEITDSVLIFSSNTSFGNSQNETNVVVSGMLMNYNYTFGSVTDSYFDVNSRVSTMKIVNSILTFTDNYSVAPARAYTNYNSLHGAITNAYLGSNMIFQDSRINITSNTARGILNVNGGQMDFINTDIDIINNSAAGEGGGILNLRYVIEGIGDHSEEIDAPNISEMRFVNSNINFVNNIADNGSAIANKDHGAIYTPTTPVSITFSSSSVSFSMHGGASVIYNYVKYDRTHDAIINFINSDVKFATNTATLIYNDAGTINFLYSTSAFYNTVSAGSGAVINNQTNSTVNFTGGNITFTGNSALGLGGAIYNEGTINLNLDGGSINFAGNTASGWGNDIHNAGIINISGDSGDIIINSGISGNGDINKTGANLIMNADASGYIGSFTQSGGTTTIYDGFFNGINSISGGTLKIEDGGYINSLITFSNSAILNINNNTSPFSLTTGTFAGDATILKTGSGELNLIGDYDFNGAIDVSGGTIKIEGNSIKIDKLIVGTGGKYDMTNNLSGQETQAGEASISGEVGLDVDLASQTADMIKAQSGSGIIDISGTSRLKLNVFGQPAQAGGQLRIGLIEAQGGISGEFFSNTLGELGLTKLGPSVKNYLLEYKTGGIDLIAVFSTGYSSLPDMTHNQKEVASAIDYITQGGSNFINESFEKMIYDEVNNLSDEGKKRAFDELSGSIIANALSQGAINYAGDEVFDRMYPSSYGDTGHTIWANVYGYGKQYKEDENSISDFKMNGYGIRGGADIFNDGEYLAGVYAGYADTDIKQGKSKGNIKDIGVGVYGGRFGDKADIKGQIYMGLLNYDMARDISLGIIRQAKSEFTAYALRIEATAGYLAYSQDLFDIKPYMGIKGGYVLNPEIEEKGGNGADIKVYSGDYMRAEAVGGVEISGGIGRINWRGKVYGQYLIAGDRGEYDGEFAGYKKEMNIRGAQDKSLGVGAAVGGEYIINENLDAFLNISGIYGEQSNGYYAGAGINYRFLERRKSVKKEDKIKKGAQEIIDIVISERNILEVWEIEGDSEGRVKINKEIADKLWLEEGETIYETGYGGRVFFFNDEDKKKRFKEELLKAGADKEEIKETQSRIEGEKISFIEYIEDVKDMSEGALLVKYSKGIAEIKEMPEEAKRVKRDEIIGKVLEDSQVSVIIKTKEEGDTIVMTKESGNRLGIKKGSKIYLVHYGDRIFVFKDRERAEYFIEELKEAGAKIGKENIREVEGVYIKDEVAIKKEEVKELGDLSKGIILEEYDEYVEEIKSLAREEEKAKREEINKEKIKEAEKRREKPVIKAYKLNIANFKTNDYELTPKAKETIRKQAKEIRKYDYKKITVEGHADSVGKEEVNKKISKKRGEVVYREFLVNGIPADKISYIGFGSTIPAETNNTDEGRAANRRTEIFVE